MVIGQISKTTNPSNQCFMIEFKIQKKAIPWWAFNITAQVFTKYNILENDYWLLENRIEREIVFVIYTFWSI